MEILDGFHGSTRELFLRACFSRGWQIVNPSLVFCWDVFPSAKQCLDGMQIGELSANRELCKIDRRSTA